MAKARNSSRNSFGSLHDIFESVKRVVSRRPPARHKPKQVSATPAPGDSEKLITVTEMSHEVLFTANTVFPFTLFPDTVTLDREKLTFASREFFRVAKITSVPIRDILSVEADIGLFFGSVHTASRYFVTNPYAVNYLWRKDAIDLQRLLQGYIIAHEQKIDCTNVDKQALTTLLNDLGQGYMG